ncbi:hypothetical protein GcC1_06475 [Golovinomyces cichoracearum]|uniref:Secreted effector protein n=1 Tax=Golovinomyces cichoracearum TaxID=62708 RepID=A0A420HM14_9PEZI|nr:hypothetical protein GcC1_06475 [Golovinomyces cichoracearum]
MQKSFFILLWIVVQVSSDIGVEMPRDSDPQGKPALLQGYACGEDFYKDNQLEAIIDKACQHLKSWNGFGYRYRRVKLPGPQNESKVTRKPFYEFKLPTSRRQRYHLFSVTYYKSFIILNEGCQLVRIFKRRFKPKYENDSMLNRFRNNVLRLKSVTESDCERKDLEILW